MGQILRTQFYNDCETSRVSCSVFIHSHGAVYKAIRKEKKRGQLSIESLVHPMNSETKGRSEILLLPPVRSCGEQKTHLHSATFYRLKCDEELSAFE